MIGDGGKGMNCPVCGRPYECRNEDEDPDDRELKSALAFYDKVAAAPTADQDAVGSDAIDWLVREARKLIT